LKIAWRRALKVRDVIKVVEADGWYHIETKGDHRQYKHPIKKGRVTIPGHPNTEMHPKTCKTILVQQAQIDIKQIRRK
jgi:predicted RNA binding protein YcfA (HicA-like mRNA interferase family)